MNWDWKCHFNCKKLTIEFYRTIDIYKFVKLYMYMKHIWKSINAKKCILNFVDSKKSTRTKIEDTSMIKFIVIIISSFIISRDMFAISIIFVLFCRFEIFTRFSHSNFVTKKLLIKNYCFQCNKIDYNQKNYLNQKIKINVVITNEEITIIKINNKTKNE